MNDIQNENGPLGPTDAQIARMHAAIHAQIAAEAAPARSNIRRNWTIGGALALLVLLAGGTSAAMATGIIHTPAWFTAAPVPGPTVTHDPVAVVTEPPTPTPMPTATATSPVVTQQGGEPRTRVELGCDELLPAATVSGVMGSGTRVDSGAESNWASTPLALDSVIGDDAQAALGALRCGWGNETRVEMLTATVTPSDVVDPTAHTGPGYTKIGDLPEFGAGASDWRDEGGGVYVDVPVNGQLLEVFTNGFTTSSAPGDAIGPALTLARAALTALSGAPAPRPAYEAPGGVNPDCSAFAHAVTSEPGTGVLKSAPPQALGIDTHAFAALDGLACSYTHTSATGTDATAAQVLYLPGGAWDWSRATSTGTGGVKLATVAGLGDQSLAGCTSDAANYSTSGGVCLVEVRSGGSWLHVRVDTADRASAIAIARSINDELTKLAG